MAVFQVLKRGFEELFPLYAFYRSHSIVEKKIQRLNNESDRYFNDHEYAQLDIQQLEKRLAEEHERSRRIDEKTTKTSIFIGMMVTANLYFANHGSIFSEIFPIIVIILLIVYTFSAIFFSMEGSRTGPLYGKSTSFLLKRKEKEVSVVVSCLCLQEKENVKKHQFNETTYMSMRNGAICIMLLISWLYYFNHNPYKDIEQSYQTCIHQDI